jgi:hypothetical protein
LFKIPSGKLHPPVHPSFSWLRIGAEVSTVNLVSRRKKPRELSAASSFAASTNSPAMNTDPAILKNLPLFRIRLSGHAWFKLTDVLLPAF